MRSVFVIGVLFYTCFAIGMEVSVELQNSTQCRETIFELKQFLQKDTFTKLPDNLRKQIMNDYSDFMIAAALDTNAIISILGTHDSLNYETLESLKNISKKLQEYRCQDYSKMNTKFEEQIKNLTNNPIANNDSILLILKKLSSLAFSTPKIIGAYPGIGAQQIENYQKYLRDVKDLSDSCIHLLK